MLSLNAEQKALFALLRDDKVENAENVNWDDVKKEALSQAVFLMLYGSKSIPKDISIDWRNTFFIETGNNMQTFYAITETDRVMRSAREGYVILKGLAAASYYPKPMRRALGDVDFLIDSNHQENVERVLEAEGYKSWGSAHICHVVFKKDRQNLEMHFEISGIPHGKPGGLVREYMKDVLGETREYFIDDATISLPLPKFHGLILLLHMQHHMVSEGLGLRHLIDWCYFVKETDGEPFWQSDLLPILESIGLLHFAKVMTKTGTLYLHTPCPEWVKDIDESLCDDVMNDIITGGNFGRKNKIRSASGMMISNHGKDGTRHSKVYNLWRTLLGGVWGYWPIVEKYHVLYAVYIPVFVIRRVFRVLTGKRTPLWKSAQYADERKSVYERLHLFEV